MLSYENKERIIDYFTYVFASTDSAITEAFYIPFVVEDFVRRGEVDKSLMSIFKINPERKMKVVLAYDYLLKLAIQFSSKVMKVLKNEKERVIDTLKQAISLIPQEVKNNQKNVLIYQVIYEEPELFPLVLWVNEKGKPNFLGKEKILKFSSNEANPLSSFVLIQISESDLWEKTQMNL